MQDVEKRLTAGRWGSEVRVTERSHCQWEYQIASSADEEEEEEEEEEGMWYCGSWDSGEPSGELLKRLLGRIREGREETVGYDE